MSKPPSPRSGLRAISSCWIRVMPRRSALSPRWSGFEMGALTVAEQGIRLFAGIGVTLLVASVIGYLLKAGVAHGRPHGVIDNLNARIRSWWMIVSAVGAAFMLGREGMVLLFAFA